MQCRVHKEKNIHKTLKGFNIANQKVRIEQKVIDIDSLRFIPVVQGIMLKQKTKFNNRSFAHIVMFLLSIT